MRKASIQRFFMVTLLSLMMMSPGCIGGDDASDILRDMPDFEAVADDGNTYSKSSMMGQSYIILFSAEWCNNPCHIVMHTIYNNLDGANVLVMSTDPNTDITLNEWHEDADDYDDDDNGTGVDLPYPFMKGVEVSQELGIDARPTLIFVNSNGDVMAEHEGGIDSIDDLKDLYDLIS
jgi:thioredoxin-related protein